MTGRTADRAADRGVPRDRWSRVPTLAAAVVVALAATSLLGWATGIRALAAISPDGIPMRVNTSLLFIALGAALALHADRPSTARLEALLCGIVALVSAATLAEYATGIDLGIDRAVAGDRWGEGPLAQRMAVQTAIGILAATGGLALLRVRLGRFNPSALLAIVPAAVGGVGLIGVAYGAPDLTGLGSPVHITTPVAIAMILLAAGIVAADPRNSLVVLLRDAGLPGQLARRLVPTMLVVIPVLGWIRLAGARAGWYDEALGAALMVAAEVAILAAVGIWLTARALRLEATRTRERDDRERAEARYEDLFEGVNEGVFLATPAGTPIAANPAMAEIFGYSSPAELLRTIESADELWMRATDRKALVDTLLRDEAVHDYRFQPRRKGGAAGWVSVSARLGRDESGATVIYEFMSDVTERQRAIEELRVSEERFRTSVETLLDPFVILTAVRNADGRIVDFVYEYANEAACVSNRTTRERQVGQRLLEFLPEHDRAGLLASYAHVVETGEPLVLDDFDYQDSWGGERMTRILDIRARKIGDSLAFTWRDVTDRRRVERERAAELEQRVRERTAELEAANRDLEGFSYSVSHDLRAPLRAIEGFCQIMVEDHAQRLDDEGRRVLGVVVDNTRRMTSLIDDLLAFSRAGRRELTVGAVDATAVAAEALAEVRAGRDGAVPVVSVADLGTVSADAALLRQVYVNLLDNAFKFTRPCHDGRVVVGREDRDGESLFFVQDNGVGFDPRYKAKLFQVFQRLHASTEFEGTGIGLALVQRIVARHGGRVWAEGESGGGATFWFALPRREETP